MEISKKTKTEITSDPAVLFLGIHPKESRVVYNIDTCIYILTEALLKIVEVWNQHRCPSVDKWISKMYAV